MKLIMRQINLIRYIQKNPQSSIKQLSEIMSVSTQTIKSDLQSMSNLMKDYDVEIEILPGNLIRIWGQENINYMLKAFQTMQEFSLEKQMMLLLVFRDDFIILQDIADMLYVSKSLVEKVMSMLLKKYPEELDSVRRHGSQYLRINLKKILPCSAAFMGLIGITEGAIPFAVKSLKTVIPSIVIGSAVGAGLGMMHGCACMVPHGGLIVLPAVSSGAAWYAIDMLIGVVVTAACLHVLRPDINTDDSSAKK